MEIEGHVTEEQVRRGFFGKISSLIKPKRDRHWTVTGGLIRPQRFETSAMLKHHGAWQRMVFNSEIVVYNYWDKRSQEPLSTGFANADGDTLYFCLQGSGFVLTEFGLLRFRPGQMVMIPKCVLHTFNFEEETQFIVIESRSQPIPSPLDPSILLKPNVEELQEFQRRTGTSVTRIGTKHGSRIVNYTLNTDAYDTLAWKGDFFPYTIEGSGLIPSPVELSTAGFSVTALAPRMLQAFAQPSLGADEVLLDAGHLTLHPAGLPRDPHVRTATSTDPEDHSTEVRIMISTWNALQVDSEFGKTEIPESHSTGVP